MPDFILNTMMSTHLSTINHIHRHNSSKTLLTIGEVLLFSAKWRTYIFNSNDGTLNTFIPID